MVNVQDRYSLTLRPNTVLPPSPLKVPRTSATDVAGWLTWPSVSGRTDVEFHECPSEFHIRECMEVEIGTRESLLKFANTFGLPGGHRAAFVPWYEQPTVETDSSRSYFEHVEAASAGLGFPTSNIRDRRLVGDIHLAELALSLDLIQRMVRHVEADQAGKPVSGAWHETDYLPPKGDILSGFLDDVPAVDAAWALLANYLNQGLRPLSPGIVGMPYAYEPKEWGFHASACALIFNDLVEKAPYRRCADEKCHRLFKNQLGRGEGLHSRSDAKYCSPQHARNQSQRERRRRERAARRSGDDGQ